MLVVKREEMFWLTKKMLLRVHDGRFWSSSAPAEFHVTQDLKSVGRDSAKALVPIKTLRIKGTVPFFSIDMGIT